MQILFIPVVLAFFLLSCGRPDPMETFRQNQRKPRATSVNSWQGSDALAANKGAVLKACKDRGVSDAQAALILSMGMAETQEIKAEQRDVTKDNSPSANYSAFNLNEDCLQQLGWQKGQGPNLNDDSSLDAAVGWVIKGLQTWGEDSFLNFHRGGRQGWQDGCSYGCGEYRETMRAVQAYLIANPSALNDRSRIGAYIPHV